MYILFKEHKVKLAVEVLRGLASFLSGYSMLPFSVFPCFCCIPARVSVF